MQTLENVFEDVESRDVDLYAALDIGSNSFHLVIARVVAGSLQTVQKIKNKVRLADGLNSKNLLSEEAMERGLATLESMAESMQGLKPENVRVVATHTLRRARNARSFLAKARKVFPFAIEIISGPEEARLIYAGIAHTTEVEGSRLIIDIGGGSTEFALGDSITPLMCKSVQMGCVSYQQRFFPQGKITKRAFNKAITAARQEIELVVANLKRFDWETTIGASGTIRAICAVLTAEAESHNDLAISKSGLTLLMQHCCEAGNSDNIELLGLSEDRRPVFAAGLSILIAIFRSLSLKSITTSNAALREGVLYESQALDGSKNVRERTAQSLATRYDVDTHYAKKVWSTCIKIYEACSKKWKIDTWDLRHLLGWSALLHEVGLQINSRGVQRHSSYIIEQSDLPGFNQEQQKLLSTLVRYHRKKIKLQELPKFINYNEDTLLKLLTILRLGIVLNINRQESQLPEFGVKAGESKIILSFPDDWFDLSPLLLADLEQENAYLDQVGIKLKIK
ncbi:exopolyphosphatase [Glaciecola sp. MH2013]|uniref:exopolyphosphatase n=1 Tax=Glaciecola sp. MH2013 TaxID=2785524 RepID=UPI0018A04CCD|nr:exopolyphosphatase [Glaciecola sp. MH2013]MBF7072014.1 exopolyphosphatase [Glaciecola sp. MH2013]